LVPALLLELYAGVWHAIEADVSSLFEMPKKLGFRHTVPQKRRTLTELLNLRVSGVEDHALCLHTSTLFLFVLSLPKPG